ncbi:MAG: glycoside hydrolase family 97 protein [Bacteroidales bacterium]|nr:glycoside hydrolase family 97 protein [Bacteroidales bacterium]
MKSKILTFAVLAFSLNVSAQNYSVSSPNGNLKLNLNCDNGQAFYSVQFNGNTFIEKSQLGLVTDLDDYSVDLVSNGFETDLKSFSYDSKVLKKSHVDVVANNAVWHFYKHDRPAFDIIFMVENNDIAFKYKVYSQPNPLTPTEPRVCTVVKNEKSYFNFPKETTTFLSTQMKGGTGWGRTAPSYETPYTVDAKPGFNADGAGFIFPALFKVQNGWVLISETGVSSSYCASHISNEGDTKYKVAFPLDADYNYNGTSCPGIPLPGETPWRTITVGENLKPIVETTIAWDFVEPLYSPSKEYTYGPGTWSWIIGMDESVNYSEQKKYLDFTADLGFVSQIVDNWWDTQIGRDSIEMLAKYAKQKGTSLVLWYNSNGYWNDAPQGPKHIMSNSIKRHKEMAWMKSIGIRGIKVDFLGSDKQQTMQLYEDILCDANEYGLEVIFHGATLPRGWEIMYPNFIACEAVQASENLHFSDDFCRQEAYNATLHPVIRNSVASMDYGGVTFNDYFNISNDTTIWGGHRVTSDVFQMAIAVLFQCPLNHTALYYNQLRKDEPWKLDFVKKCPTLWNDIKFIDGYPGKYLIMARRSGDKWYVVAINADNQPLKKNINLDFISGDITIYSDDANLKGSVKYIKSNKKNIYQINVPKNGATIFVGNNI